MLDFLGRSSKDRNPWVYANELRSKALWRLRRRKARQRLQDWDAEWEEPLWDDDTIFEWALLERVFGEDPPFPTPAGWEDSPQTWARKRGLLTRSA